MRILDYPIARKIIYNEICKCNVVILAWNKNGIISSGIRYITDDEFNHISGVKPEYLPNGKVANRIIHGESIARGFTPNRLSWSINKKDVNYVCAFSIENINNIKFQQLIIQMINTRYGYKIIPIHYLINRGSLLLGSERFTKLIKKFNLNDKVSEWTSGSEICSQAWVDIIEKSSNYEYNKSIPNWSINPGMFCKWKILNPLFIIKGGGYKERKII